MKISSLLDTSETFSEVKHLLWKDFVDSDGPDQVERDLADTLQKLVAASNDVVQAPPAPKAFFYNAVKGAQEASDLFFSSCTHRNKCQSVRPYRKNRIDIMTGRVQMYLKRAKACCRSTNTTSVSFYDSSHQPSSYAIEKIVNKVPKCDHEDENYKVVESTEISACMNPFDRGITKCFLHELHVSVLSTRNITSSCFDDGVITLQLRLQILDEAGNIISLKESKVLETTKIAMRNQLPWTLSSNIELRLDEFQSKSKKQNINVALYLRPSHLTSASSNLIGQLDISIDTAEVVEAQSICRWFSFHIVSPTDLQGEIQLGLSVISMEEESQRLVRDPIQGIGMVEVVPLVSGSSDDNCIQQTDCKFQQCEKSMQKQRFNATNLSIRNDSRRSARSRMQVFSPPSSQSGESQSDSEEATDCNRQIEVAPEKSVSSPGLASGAPSKLLRKSRKKEKTKSSSVMSSRTRFQPKQIASVQNVKPFLRRKNQEVVSRKLDWSNIRSRTDSNHINHPTCSRNSVSRSNSNQNSQQELESMKAFVSSVCEEVYQICNVTSGTASMAHIKYKAERRNIIRNILASPRGNNNQNDEAQETKKAATIMDSIWTTLATDYTGKLYADMLQDLEISDKSESLQKG